MQVFRFLTLFFGLKLMASQKVVMLKQVFDAAGQDAPQLELQKPLINPRKALMTSGNPYTTTSQYVPQTKPQTYSFPMAITPTATPTTTYSASNNNPNPQLITKYTYPDNMVLVPKNEYLKYKTIADNKTLEVKTKIDDGNIDRFMNRVNNGIVSGGNYGVNFIGATSDILNNAVRVQGNLVNNMVNTQSQTYETILKNQQAMKNFEESLVQAQKKTETASQANDSSKSYYTTNYASGFLKKGLI